MKPELRLRIGRRVTVSPGRGVVRLHEVVPTVVLHLAAAGVSEAAVMGMGAVATPLLAGGVAVCALVFPVVGLALSLAGWLRSGAAMLVLTFVSSSALGLYSLLGLGALQAALDSPFGAWKLVYFLSAAALPLLQMKGIIEAGRVLVERR
jgi:hypothetical protein